MFVKLILFKNKTMKTIAPLAFVFQKIAWETEDLFFWPYQY